MQLLCHKVETYCRMVSEWDFITQAAPHRLLAYGGPAIPDIALTGRRLPEVIPVTQIMMTKTFCVDGTVLLFLLGILRSGVCKHMRCFMMAHAFWSTSSHVAQYGTHATDPHPYGFTFLCTSVSTLFQHCGTRCRKEQRSYVDLNPKSLPIYIKLATQRP